MYWNCCHRRCWRDSIIRFQCDQCSYESASDKGVRQHNIKKHIISQLDEQDDCEVNSSDSEKNLFPLCPEESGYCVNRICKECEYIATEQGFTRHIMSDHEPKDLFKHFGLVWIKDNMKNIRRNLNYPQDRYHLQKWASFLSCKWNA